MSNIIYPENVDQVSVLNDDNVQTPIHRIALNEDSTFSIFTFGEKQYGDDNVIHYMLIDIEPNEEEPGTVVMTIVNVDNPDVTFKIDIQIHYLNSAFLISQMLKTAMFMVTPSDDHIASLSFGPFEKDEIKVYIDAPVRKTVEFSKISKKILEMSKAPTAPRTQVSVSSEMVDEVRREIIDIITGLVKGDPKSVEQAYAHIADLDATATIDLANNESLTDNNKKALIMKDMLLKLEQSSHPIAMSHMFSNTEDPREYTKDIEEFEAILDTSNIPTDFNIENLQDITLESSDEDVIAYLNSPIELKYMPKDIQALMMGVEIDYFWNFKWHSALEEQVVFSELRSTGEFFISLLFVISIRMARLRELYRLSGNPDLSPMANLATGLTQQGESFEWVLRDSLSLIQQDKNDAIIDLLTIPPDQSIGKVSGPVSMILHALAHTAIDLDIPASAIDAALSNEPNMAQFLNRTLDIKSSLPDFIVSIKDESACFIKGVVFAYLQEGITVTKEYADEMIRAVKILAELTLLKTTSASMNSPEWKEGITKFYDDFLR